MQIGIRKIEKKLIKYPEKDKSTLKFISNVNTISALKA